MSHRKNALVIAGLSLSIGAFVASVLVPIYVYQSSREQPIAALPNPNLMYQFEDLSRRYPEAFKKHFGEPTRAAAAESLRLGRAVYIGEGCWHCHTQYVRPVANDSRRWGPASQAWEYENALQRPALFGSRRVGPDLSREGGRHSNDWHAVHLFEPTMVSTDSPMPAYPWLFDGAPNQPTQRGLALITYLQWLGSWLHEYPDYENFQSIEQMEQSMLEAGVED